MSRALAGVRIRERRRALGVKQAELARRMGISPSYLNLIERNKRGATPPLMRAAADALGLPLDALDGAAEQRLAETLGEIAADPDYRDLDIDPARAMDFITRSPGWARALARAWHAHRETTRAAEALSDRLSHDPLLSDIVHRMLTNIAAIRSTSEILEGVEDIDAAQRRRFHVILLEESRRISEVAGNLARFFDADRAKVGVIAPGDQAEDFFLAADNRFEPLEAATRALLAGTAAPGDETFRRLLAERGVAVLDGDPDDPGRQSPRATPERMQLVLPVGAPLPARRAAAARALAQTACAAPIRAIIAAPRPGAEDGAPTGGGAGDAPPALGDSARALIADALADYAADALIAPYDAIIETGRRLRWDVDALAAHFGAGFDQIARRMTTLTRADHAGPRAACMCVNAAGHPLARRNLIDLTLPRYGAACPLWAVYRALSVPGRTIRQFAEYPGGERFVFVARADAAGETGYDRPRHFRASLLALPGEAANATVYAPGLRETPEPVGPNCRICARRDCRHRVEDAVFV